MTSVSTKRTHGLGPRPCRVVEEILKVDIRYKTGFGSSILNKSHVLVAITYCQYYSFIPSASTSYGTSYEYKEVGT
jgi:hypothetical protein